MAGTYPGASWAGVSPNKSPRQGKVQLFIVHHWAGGYVNPPAAAVAQRNVFMGANSRQVSPNWQVNWDGSVWEIVPPDQYRAWTTGAIDHQAVTVETQNISGPPNWGISRESMEAIAQLVAWSSARYGFPIQRGAVNPDDSVARLGVVGHRETPAGKSTGTACPGPSMDLDWIVNRAREITGGVPVAATTTDKEEDHDMYAIRQIGIPDSGIIIRPGTPPYPLAAQVFEAEASTYGLTIREIPDWRYATAVREQWTAYNVAEKYRADRELAQGDVQRVADAVRAVIATP